MISITNKELEIEKDLKKKIEFLCDFCNIKPKIKDYIEQTNDTIDELEDKITTLESTLNYFKELWKKFIEFLQDKFFSTNKYDDIINELYNEKILDDNDVDIIQNSYKDKNDKLER